MKTEYKGILEIDHDRGVIYFHTDDPRVMKNAGTMTPVRICTLPKPIPKHCFIDLTHMYGVQYGDASFVGKQT